MTHTLKLGKATLDLDDYAIQGNAIVGIKEAGKTYTATYLAERLMDAGIPITVFDPIDVWRFLRVPGAGRGYPVVVAGQGGDLPLTVESAPKIVEAAMAAGVSLVLNLYSPDLSKADWRRIVTECVRTLFYQNGQHGPRHIFLEEAPEFVPQRIGPGHAQVYGEMEKLARMGGNVQLGYTLIGQRSEEINKAILEICDGLFLHRQKGRNSLTAVGKWLDVAGADNKKQVMASIPLLNAGECWVWGRASDKPAKAHIPTKNSLHPDRRERQQGRGQIRASVDVGQFVAEMQGILSAKKNMQRVIDWHREESPMPRVDEPLVQAWNEDPPPRIEILPVIPREPFDPPIVEEEDDMGVEEQKLLRQILERLPPANGAPLRAGDPVYQALDPETVYNYVLERLKQEAPGLLVKLAHTVSEIHVSHKAKVVEVDTSNLRGQLLLLVAEGLFADWFSGTAATKALAERGWRTADPNVYRALDALVKDGVLQKKERQGYRKVDSVRVLHKGA